ncbi:hypothetical protein Zmor_014655 [Zophobas morio]|uniref:Uncharacterized protein n=1 Tax=Zophobas morio TaxID=2755281 RepID=A0AA38ICS8_9CUCU|nr:hypothetical protein Zmor_014655 [Zophobas morio]
MEIPEEIRKKALSVVQNLLPDTSKELYDREYQLFKQWMRSRFGGWSSDKVATGYVEDSLEQKIKIARKILIDSSVSVSSCDVVENGPSTGSASVFEFHKCVVHFHNK